MSGHSHWAGIKHKKSIKDAKRSQIFSKISRWLSVAARKGSDPEMNSELKMAIEKAREVNMPQENIERAIKRGMGKAEGGKLEYVLIEGFGPEGTTVIVEAITDNKNRTLSEIRQIFERFQGKLAPGGVLWQFERKGCITLNLKSQIFHPPKFLPTQTLKKLAGAERKTWEGKNLKPEDLEFMAIESGAEDISWRGERLEIYTKLEDLDRVKRKLQEKNVKIEETSLDRVPREEMEIKEEEKRKKIKDFFETLDENSDVQDIYSNVANLEE